MGMNPPQWSPPLNGGTTGVFGGLMGQGKSPQWSPPLNGGTTAHQIRAV
jgi:hypothetical protein